MDNNVKMVPAICTQCGGTVEVDKTQAEAKCPFCGTSFVIEKAINNYNVKYATIEHADNVNIDVTGAVKEVLDFAGTQMSESRKVRSEQRKIDSELHSKNTIAFFKLYGFMFAGMLVFGLIAFIIMQFTGNTGDDEQVEEAGTSVIECQVKEGTLFTDIDISDDLEWKYQNFDSYGVSLSSEDSYVNSYHSCIVPNNTFDEGVGYAITAGFDRMTMASDPSYYCVVKVYIDNYQIINADDPVIVESLSEYNYE